MVPPRARCSRRIAPPESSARYPESPRKSRDAGRPIINFMKPVLLLAMAAATLTVAFSAEPQAPPIGKLLDGQVRQVESEVGSLAEAMPADKYNFAPTDGEFKGVRTFSQQMTHIATVIYEVSAASLGEKCPVETGQNENGSPSIQGKEAVVKYLKDS